MAQQKNQCDCNKTNSDCKNQAELELLHAKVLRLEQELNELNELVRTDGLTGLYNHRYFREALHREFERTQRTGVDFCLALVDLDHFKRVNDTHGHEFGNLALKHTATLIKETIRPMDLPCRYGGEEFAILLPGTSLLTSRQVAERIRQSIESTTITNNDITLNITASFGIASYTKNTLMTEDQLIEAADKQLYTAKQNGRNQICYAPVSPPEHHQVSQDEKDLLLGSFGGDN